MPYKTKAEQEREKWMTFLEAIVHIRSADGCDENEARRQLIAALVDGARVLQPLKWDREPGDKPSPFWPTSIMTRMDTPPLGRAWSEAEIRWKTGRVRDDWGNGKWRRPLLPRHGVARQWPPASPSDPSPLVSPAGDKVVDISAARKRGPKSKIGNKIRDSIRKDIREDRLTVQRLKEMKEEELAAMYGGSRDTCRKARNAVLSEFVENSPKQIVDK